MNKLAWVLLPLLGAALLTTWLAWRRRLPPRPLLNAWSSLLLLIYLLATAGLGIFWVANQQLPVFDWHYLFGYATVLLLLVHLVFNLRLLIDTLRRGHAGSRRPVTAGRRPLTGLLALGGVLALLGGAYWLGRRHGSTELRLDGGGGVASAAAAWAVVEAFHVHSAHSRAGVVRRAASTDWGPAPAAFKSYPDRRLRPLPTPSRAAAEPARLDAQALATLLWSVQGVTAERGGLRLRAAPSSGALFATELYLATRAVDGVPPGLWHADALAGGLRPLRAGLPMEIDAMLPDGVDAALLASAVFRRSGHKYGERSYRYVTADLGHALENLRVAAVSIGLGVHFVTAFDEAAVAAALGLDQAEEGVLALLWLQAPGAPPPVVGAAAAWRVPLATVAAPLGMTEAVHRATSLRAAAGVLAHWQPPTPDTRQPMSPAAAAQPLPGRARPLADPLGLMATRRSIRRYRAEAVPLPLLTALLDAVAAPGPRLSGAVRVHVVAHAVEGLAPGAWHYDAAAHALQPAAGGTAGPRARSRAAALDQDAAGDAAAVLVFTLDLAALRREGARGYRHGLLEVGLCGERLYLQAEALGLGVCAIGAFYDDEASALIGIAPAREWVLHFAALGWPA